MRMNSIGMLGQLPRFAIALAGVLALCAAVASTGLTTADRTDPALVLARAAAPNTEGAVPPHTIGLTADYFAAIGISEAADRSPAEAASPVTPSNAAPELLARRRPDAASSEDTPLGKARVCGDSSVSLAAAKAPPTTES